LVSQLVGQSIIRGCSACPSIIQSASVMLVSLSVGQLVGGTVDLSANGLVDQCVYPFIHLLFLYINWGIAMIVNKSS